MKFTAYNFNDLSLGYKNTMRNKANLKKRNNRNEKKTITEILRQQLHICFENNVSMLKLCQRGIS